MSTRRLALFGLLPALVMSGALASPAAASRLALSILPGLTSAVPAAQTLTLDAGPSVPPLDEANATRSLLGLVSEEMDALETKRRDVDAADERAIVALDARLQLRRVIRDLLVRGADGGGVHDLLAMHGFRLADVRRRVDILLGAFADGSLQVGDPPAPLTVRQRDVALRRLKRFLERSPAAFGAATLSDRDQIDATVGAATFDLGVAIALLEGSTSLESLDSGWPTAEDLAATLAHPAALGIDAAPTDPAAGDDDPCAGLETATLAPKTGAALRAACAGQPQALEPLRAARRLASEVHAATWLSEAERDELDREAAALVAGAGDAGVSAARADLLRADRLLASAAAQAKAIKLVERETLETTLRLALIASPSLAPSLGDDPRRLARTIERITQVFELSREARAREPDQSLPRDMRQIARDFERAFARTEASTYKRLHLLLTSEDALSDPALLTLTSSLVDALRDLDRISTGQRLVDAIGGVRPAAAKLVAAHVRTMLRWMLEPSRRSAGLTTFETLELQVRLFSPLPFEAELRRETDQAIELTGGNTRQLVAAIDALRSAWADAWGNGEGSGPAAQRLVQIHRLTRMFEAFAGGMSAPDSRDDIALLTRWGAFHATRASMSPAMVDLGGSLKLATQAVVSGDWATVDRELQRMERHVPMVRLVGRLLDELRPWLMTRPGGATGVFAAIGKPADGAAWGLPIRDRLASLARYARELDHLRRTGAVEREAAFLEYLASLSRTILESLGEERSPIPPLPALVEPTAPSSRRPRSG